jgi:hypothetical protein
MVRCYFCGDTSHDARECDLQIEACGGKERMVQQLTPEIIEEHDRSREGTLSVGSPAPDVAVYRWRAEGLAKEESDEETLVEERLTGRARDGIPLVLSFGSMS